mmetsp:Transcript_18500/g.53352  ORF Transcript_18500/g.53352 Transcript_18500/m.53352 type:complete len:163 (-) Transcript_18500:440-928(-)
MPPRRRKRSAPLILPAAMHVAILTILAPAVFLSSASAFNPAAGPLRAFALPPRTPSASSLPPRVAAGASGLLLASRRRQASTPDSSNFPQEARWGRRRLRLPAKGDDEDFDFDDEDIGADLGEFADTFDGAGFAGYLAPYALALFVSVGVTAAFVKYVLLDY